MTWTYDVKALANHESQRILACLATDTKDSRQMIIAHAKQGKLKARGLDLTSKCYAWKLAEDFAPFDDPTPKPKEVFKDVAYGESKTEALTKVAAKAGATILKGGFTGGGFVGPKDRPTGPAGVLSEPGEYVFNEETRRNLQGLINTIKLADTPPSVYVEPNNGWTTGKCK